MTTLAEGASASVDAIHFSFMSKEEVKGLSFKKITSPILLDNLLRPVEDGLYDLALGSFDDAELCKSCGQRSWQCPGHCGHIDLVLPVYNPLLFQTLHVLLRKSCFFCHHFKLSREKVRAYATRLDRILKGEVVGDGNLDSPLLDDEDYSKVCHSTAKDLEQHEWTSLQHSQARTVLDEFMKEKPNLCMNCKAHNPKITSPTFGWLQKDSLKSSHLEANVIRGVKLDQSLIDEAEQHPVRVLNAQHDGGEHTSSSVEQPDVEQSGARAEDMAEITMPANENIKENLLEFLKQKKLVGPLLPTEVKLHLERLCKNEAHLYNRIVDIQRKSLSISGVNKSYSMFFIEALLVPPSRFRPLCRSEGMVMDHPQSVLLSKVVQSNITLGNAYMNNSERAKVVPRWMDLQLAVNVLFDSKKALRQADRTTDGICQLLEKKEGIFRQKMMGKRVNFACRSVISPDPYLGVNEIGIPPYFALRLTYPERVTPWNVSKLRHAIINGAELHPGATHYVDKSAVMKLPPSLNSRISISRKLPSSRGVVTHHGKSLESEFEGKVVYRHLQDGDIVLVNRQPTLHKPSMMAHIVRVLKGEKTLRMHYTNCSTYNADFDGDELNVHFPQDEISRAEAFYIANANKQYTVPSSGDPIRGLIQDHIISAVLLTKDDTFLSREEYHQLLYASCMSATAASKPSCCNSSKKICILSCDDEIEPILPAIWKPKPLWTGKQVITTILNHITRGHPPFTVENDVKIQLNYIGKRTREGKLLIQKNEFVHGVIDKAQFGKYGLVHTVQELYGSNAAGILLSVFSRLFTVFLQMHGFTCGVDDLLIVQRSNIERKMMVESSEKIGEHVHTKFIGSENDYVDPMKLQMEIESAIRGNGESAVRSLDRRMSNALLSVTTEVNQKLFPDGLLKTFPRNCFSLMTTTGAKGGFVNLTQVSSLLGQQELEGKRVPRMVSGKTLPCFHPWDSASRAGGFISDRFLSGLRPQEYYFHCMAGREGLVDTAVKTSRSGYLQRCLIKSLECLKVCYDHTVRDADGSIVQFCYGEDGVDVQKTSFISQFETLAANQTIITEKLSSLLDAAQLAKSDAYIRLLPRALEEKAKNFFTSLSEKKREILKLRNEKKFMKLMKLKYLSSLAQPGEAVGVLAAQAVGEPSTQMTLNTFHLAGRGEMNVTLGVPRLQEILQRASQKILTPVMTCPLKEGRTRDDAERLSAKLKKISVADIVESMEVSVVPCLIQDQQVCSIHKLKMKLYPPELYPPYSEITLKDCMRTLKVKFIRELEDSIQSHILTLSKIKTIKIITDKMEHASRRETDEDKAGSKSKEETDEDEAGSKSKEAGGEDVDGDGDDDDGLADDLGVDAHKRKMRAADEMDYEDGLENEIPVVEDEHGGHEDGLENEIPVVEDEHGEQEHSVGFESEIDQVETDDDYELGGENEIEDGQNQIFDAEDEDPGSSSKLASKSSSSVDNLKDAVKEDESSVNVTKKKTDRAFFVAAKGLNFKVHFRFKNEPHILLTQIAQKAAKKVYVKSSGKIDSCIVIDYKGDPNIPALQTAGVNLQAFWEMDEDVLDFRKITSNDICAMLNAYGVEAATATIINEVKGVFRSYGISVNIRHLALIADYMTAGGGYRAMNRFGMANSSTSPFCKMSFETATKFIVEAALHGEVDRLESPSARISLGLPIKMGTGTFDLLQNLQV